MARCSARSSQDPAPATVGTLRHRLRDLLGAAAATVLAVARSADPSESCSPRRLFQSIGLVRGFGRLLVLCGHAQHHREQPLPGLAGLRGLRRAGRRAQRPHRGADPQRPRGPRRTARGTGIDMPADTLVVAAVHDTTTDRVTVLDEHLIPATHRADVARLQRRSRARRRRTGGRTVRDPARRPRRRCAGAGGAPRRGALAGLGAGVPRVGAGRQRRLRRRAARRHRRDRPAAAGVPALLRRRRRRRRRRRWRPS